MAFWRFMTFSFSSLLKEKTCDLGSSTRFFVVAANLILAVSLALVCFVPVFTWGLLILYLIGDSLIVALLTLLMWLWSVGCSVMLVRVAYFAQRENRWDLKQQFLPIVVGLALFLLTIAVGGWDLIARVGFAQVALKTVSDLCISIFRTNRSSRA